MRISNPPPGAGISVSVSQTTPPSTLVTTGLVTVTVGGATNILIDTSRAELILANLDTASTVWVNDSATSTVGVGIPVAPGSTLFLSTQASVNLVTSGTGVNVAVSRTRNI